MPRRHPHPRPTTVRRFSLPPRRPRTFHVGLAARKRPPAAKRTRRQRQPSGERRTLAYRFRRSVCLLAQSSFSVFAIVVVYASRGIKLISRLFLRETEDITRNNATAGDGFLTDVSCLFSVGISVIYLFLSYPNFGLPFPLCTSCDQRSTLKLLSVTLESSAGILHN